MNRGWFRNAIRILGQMVEVAGVESQGTEQLGWPVTYVWHVTYIMCGL